MKTACFIVALALIASLFTAISGADEPKRQMRTPETGETVIYTVQMGELLKFHPEDTTASVGDIDQGSIRVKVNPRYLPFFKDPLIKNLGIRCKVVLESSRGQAPKFQCLTLNLSGTVVKQTDDWTTVAISFKIAAIDTIEVKTHDFRVPVGLRVHLEDVQIFPQVQGKKGKWWGDYIYGL